MKSKSGAASGPVTEDSCKPREETVLTALGDLDRGQLVPRGELEALEGRRCQFATGLASVARLVELSRELLGRPLDKAAPVDNPLYQS